MKSELEITLARMARDAWVEFNKELETDENKDYRRGFRAGALFGLIELQRVIKDYEDEK